MRGYILSCRKGEVGGGGQYQPRERSKSTSCNGSAWRVAWEGRVPLSGDLTPLPPPASWSWGGGGKAGKCWQVALPLALTKPGLGW